MFEPGNRKSNNEEGISSSTLENDQEPGNSAGTDPISYVPPARQYDLSSDEEADLDAGMLESSELTPDSFEFMKSLGLVGFMALNEETAKPRTVASKFKSKTNDRGQAKVKRMNRRAQKSLSKECLSDDIPLDLRKSTPKSLGVVGFRALNKKTAKPRTVASKSKSKTNDGGQAKVKRMKRLAQNSLAKKCPPDDNPLDLRQSKPTNARQMPKPAKTKRRDPKLTGFKQCREVFIISSDTDDGESSIAVPKRRILPKRGCKKASGSYTFPDEIYAYFPSQPSKKSKPKTMVVEEEWLARTVRGVAVNSRRNLIFRIQYMKEGETKWVRLSKVWGCVDLIIQYVIKDGRRWEYCTHNNLAPNANGRWELEDRSDGVCCDQNCASAKNAPWYEEGEDASKPEADDSIETQKRFLALLKPPLQDQNRHRDFETKIHDLFPIQPLVTQRKRPSDLQTVNSTPVDVDPHGSPECVDIGSIDSPSPPPLVELPSTHTAPTHLTQQTEITVMPKRCPIPRHKKVHLIDVRGSNEFSPIGSSDSLTPLSQATPVRPRRPATLNDPGSQGSSRAPDEPTNLSLKPCLPSPNQTDSSESDTSNSHSEPPKKPGLQLKNPCFVGRHEVAVPIKLELKSKPLATSVGITPSFRSIPNPPNPRRTRPSPGNSMITKRLLRPVHPVIGRLSRQDRPTPPAPKPLMSIPGLEGSYLRYRHSSVNPYVPRPVSRYYHYKPRTVALNNPDGTNRYPCSKCVFTFKSENSLRKHCKERHRSEEW